MLDWLLSNFRWYRRLCGGHWEQWWIDVPFTSDIWMRNEHGTRPPGGRGTPRCESW